MHNTIITHCHCHSCIHNIVCIDIECCIIIPLYLITLSLYCTKHITACNPAGVASPSGNMTVVFTLGSLLGVAVLAVIAAVIILGIIICLCACRRKQKAKDTGKSLLYTVQVVCGWNGLLECNIAEQFKVQQ